MIGLYHSEMAKLSVSQGAAVMRVHFKQAAEAYMEAAMMFPPDDENYACTSSHYIRLSSCAQCAHLPGFLKCALDNYHLAGTPIKVILPIMEKIRLAIPEMKLLWEHSTMSMGGRDTELQKVLWMEEDIRKAVEEGKFTMDSMVMPES